MIKFFRKIRYDLMGKNKTGKYFKYAIGEIILVVIGILIALQINNWNINNNLRSSEVKLLKELKSDLVATNMDLITDMKRAEWSLIYTDSLYQEIINQRKEKKARQLIIPLFYNFERSALYPKQSAYESILSFGINNISNDSLRQYITDFYQLHLTRIKDVENLIETLNRQKFNPLLKKISKPYHYTKNNKTLSEMYSTYSVSKENAFLLENPNDEIIHFLKEKYQFYQVINSFYAETQLRIDKLIELINIELEK